MTAIPHSPQQPSQNLSNNLIGANCVGPLTRSRQRRSAFIYAALCLIGLVPILGNFPAGWQVTGLGLWIPGGGFVGVGGWATLLFPVTLGLFALSLIAWFGAGMIVAPIIIWLGSAVIAGAMAVEPVSPINTVLVATITVGIVGWRYRQVQQRDAKDRKRLEKRQQFLPKALATLDTVAVPRRAVEDRELSFDDLCCARYTLERGLQPVGDFGGFDVIDQFQTASLRYQINQAGYSLALLQCHYTPNFHGYLNQAQRNLIDKYMERKVWSYWIYETAWGQLNFSNFDPAAKDNIMLTGWFGLHLGMYMSNTGDRRYEQPGALTFEVSKRKIYPHNYSSIQQSVVDNFHASDFCLYPCEPNWLYPVCNFYGMASVVLFDRLAGHHHVADILPRWLEQLDREFIDAKGTIIGLRSQLTGMRMPFPTSEVTYVSFMNAFAPERAKVLWAIARTEISRLIKKDDSADPYLFIPGNGIDFGNYRKGLIGNYTTIMGAAFEMGDTEIGEAAARGLERAANIDRSNGVVRYANGSNLSNLTALSGRIRQRDDYRVALVEGPGEAALSGPILAGASYPDVLVAKARSHGEDLDLVLYPGVKPGHQTLQIERLKPQQRYRLAGREETFTASSTGAAELGLILDGRTHAHIVPVHR